MRFDWLQRRGQPAYVRLGKRPEFADLRLITWAHMLGFHSHFSTQSRAYSTTLSALHAEAAAADIFAQAVSAT